ncbi:MAG TPA: hypothetical protein VK735_21180 [Pseudonocardia sp.]|jgi:hypothetical protein|uniref:hypothetical protein n=1 Tax=Pseudonocardia sp. TaxID=60912 RepID=UPI002BCA690E|nr:hypothetical protein [Pseudonocardia sp.]HTF49964.1 hypothetical protein [Pseudonocardia sp.]
MTTSPAPGQGPDEARPYPDGPEPYPNYPSGGDQSSLENYPGGTGPAGDPLVPQDFGGWFQRVVAVIKRSFPQLALLQLIYALVAAAFNYVLTTVAPGFASPAPDFGASYPIGQTDTGPFLWTLAIGLVVSYAASGFVFIASTWVAIRDADGMRTTAIDGLRSTAGRVLPLLGWMLLTVFVAACAGFVVGAGAAVVGLLGLVLGILLVVGAVYASVAIFGSLLGVVVVERGGIGRCFALIRRRFWATTGRTVIFGLIATAYSLIVSFIAISIGGGPISITILQFALIIPMGVAAVAVTVVTYAELRFRENPTTTTHSLAAELIRP